MTLRVFEPTYAPKQPDQPPRLALAPKGEQVTFVDPQPDDRYNLVFYTDYRGLSHDPYMEAVVEAYYTFCHKRFPEVILPKDPWKKEAKGSRAFCKAEMIEKVDSLETIIRKLIKFMNDHKSEKKKFGTIILDGHGNENAFVLPITSGGGMLHLDALEIGLQSMKKNDLSDANVKQKLKLLPKPSEWTWVKPSWESFRSDLVKLKDARDELKECGIVDWLDGSTLIRVWCCNLGREPKFSADSSLRCHDPLGIFAEILFGDDSDFMIEAPKYRSDSGSLNFSGMNEEKLTDKECAKIFIDHIKKYLHPDVVSMVESNDKLFKYEGDDLQKARATFFRKALEDKHPVVSRHDKWIAYSFVRKGTTSMSPSVYQNKWYEFSQLWRRFNILNDFR